MEIAYRDILLRDRREQDIADWIRWNTVQTQWTQWDAPWEAEESDAARDPGGIPNGAAGQAVEPGAGAPG